LTAAPSVAKFRPIGLGVPSAEAIFPGSLLFTVSHD
jgi:hypothetical protein